MSSISPLTYQDLPHYPGEDLSSAAVLRAKENIPKSETVTFTEGVTWFRWFNQSQDNNNSEVTPIIISIGGTGTAIFYNTFASKVANLYNGPVLIYDRFNMGLSDRIETQYNGCALWFSQLDQLLDSDAVGLKGKQVHFCTFSLATNILLPYAARHSERIRSVAFLSGGIGGGSPFHQQRMRKMSKTFSKIRCFCCCFSSSIITRAVQKKVIPSLYERCEHQVMEGGDPVGLPVAKAMYRVKGFASKFVEQMMENIVFDTIFNGAADECVKLAETKMPVYARNYMQDQEVDHEKFARVWDILKEGNELSRFELKEGEHHKFYIDDTADTLVHFFQESNRQNFQ